MLKLWVVVVAVLAFWMFGGGEDSPPPSDAASQDERASAGADEPGQDQGHRPERPARKQSADPDQATPSAVPDAERPPPRAPRTWLVTRVVDGDTIELGNGADVRIVGIDTPERGECGFDAATANMSRLVLGEQVRLTMSDEDTDAYGRWLRYVDVGPVDAGLRQIEGGFAIARYDSRDGYGFHRREPAYVRADDGHEDLSCSRPAPTPPPKARSSVGSACAPGYSPCLPPYPPDVDCADADGPVRVSGSDPHGLDADGDGVACE